jgi:transglutaminase-like putative cysteine protease
VRESAETATTRGWKEGAAFDLMAAVAVPVKEPIEAPRELERIRLKVAGLNTVLPVSDRRQSFQDGMLRVVREDASLLGTYPLPYDGAEWQADLRETPFLQVDHPRVQSTTAKILGGETDARRAAERLRRWVFDQLEKVPTTSIPNALQVLEMGAGDCNEHAVLWAALARAAGLPARVVAGIVYVDGVFLYHAWNEVWLGSAWVSVDAAFDQMPVDATHVKFIEGGPEAHAALVPLLGSLSIDVVAAGDEPRAALN